MPAAEEASKKLQAKARPDQIEGMSKFGMTADRRLGVSVPDMRQIAKELGKDHNLALALWKTGSPEAKMVASMIDEPEKLTEKQMENWVTGFNSWDVCDQVCMNLFEKSPLAWKKVKYWSKRDDISRFSGKLLFAATRLHWTHLVMQYVGYLSYSFTRGFDRWQVASRPLLLWLGARLSTFASNTDFVAEETKTITRKFF
jgi:3-methyladenine DNA glycosylase AlkD